MRTRMTSSAGGSGPEPFTQDVKARFEQLLRLREVATMPLVTLQVLPAGAYIPGCPL